MVASQAVPADEDRHRLGEARQVDRALPAELPPPTTKTFAPSVSRAALIAEP